MFCDFMKMGAGADSIYEEATDQKKVFKEVCASRRSLTAPPIPA